MSQQDNPNKSVDSILVALDQISQTIDVMTNVVGELRVQVLEQKTTSSELDKRRPMLASEDTDYTLH